MTRKKWADLRAAHPEDPGILERYEAAREELDNRLAVYWALEELVPSSVDLAQLWEKVDQVRDAGPDTLRRRLSAMVWSPGKSERPDA